MPTPSIAFAAVAAAVSGVRADDRAAVDAFYRHDLPAMGQEAQIAIAEFLVAQTDAPTQRDLRRLMDYLDRHRPAAEAAPIAAAM